MRLAVFGTRDARLLAALRRVARRVDAGFAPGPGLVNVVLVTDRRIHRLNRDWLGRDRATDVISFRLDAREPGRAPLIGEVYVSRDRAREQARGQGVALRDELTRLVLHGLLHLMGLTHARMKPFEREWNR